MLFLSKLAAVLNHPKVGATAMRGSHYAWPSRVQRDLWSVSATSPHRLASDTTHMNPSFFHAIDRCSLETGPEDVREVKECAGRSRLTPLCNPSCRSLAHPRTMERLSLVSLLELYGVDSIHLANSIGLTAAHLKSLGVKEQLRALFCLRTTEKKAKATTQRPNRRWRWG